jgi:hypothetical protein
MPCEKDFQIAGTYLHSYQFFNEEGSEIPCFYKALILFLNIFYIFIDKLAGAQGARLLPLPRATKHAKTAFYKAVLFND